MPQIPRRWTPEEDKLLRSEVLAQLENGAVKDWQYIASKLPSRTNKDCRKRWHNVVSGGMNKGHWTQAEDKLLKEAVEKYGKNWTTVANAIKSRNADQSSKRWKQFLDPELDRSQWTDEENQLLLEVYKTKHSQWKEIQVEHFPMRSRNAIKNQFTILSRRQKHAERNSHNENPISGKVVSGCLDDNENSVAEDQEMTLVDPLILSSDENLSEDDFMIDPLGPTDKEEFFIDTMSVWDSHVGNNSHCTSDPSTAADVVAQESAASTVQEFSDYLSAEDMSPWTFPDSSQSAQASAYDFSYHQPHPDNMHVNATTHKDPFLFDGPSLSAQVPLLVTAANCENLTQEVSTGFGVGASATLHDSIAVPGVDEIGCDLGKITLTIYNPRADTVDSLLKVALTNRSEFHFEKN